MDGLGAPSSVTGSPPIEVVSVSADDDDADFGGDESVTMLDDSGRYLAYDPTVSFPFHDATETYAGTVERLLQYFPTHDQVPRAFTDWIGSYLGFVKHAHLRAIEDSYFSYRDIWELVPQLLLHMVNRK